ncbi:TIGR02647 family protein [Marinobacterium arenosum]|uniref:TIGR02647 family protein n=1 Tax=Marinobacterium arenosum TaxID=2862496 RepID=UPI001C94C4C4|nr:TIGR02647 family protein [Marinobacterium arenosum]MBY4678516.1 TIGR02647 family protein [Marinobacterium arenosum]
MPISTDFVEELKILALFNLSTSQEGIKVHHTAAEDAIAATERLYHKGLVTQVDGGYLTGLGRDAAEHTQALLGILKDQ